MRRTPPDKLRILRELAEQELPTEAIQERLGVGRRTVCRLRRMVGVDSPPPRQLADGLPY